jgi:hypothetical protein
MNIRGIYMKYIICILTLLSSQVYADIESFNNDELKLYSQSNRLKTATSDYNDLKTNISIDEYSDLYIRVRSSNSVDKNRALEEMASICAYNNMNNRHVSINACQDGSITESSQDYIRYKYTLQKMFE